VIDLTATDESLDRSKGTFIGNPWLLTIYQGLSCSFSILFRQETTVLQIQKSSDNLLVFNFEAIHAVFPMFSDVFYEVQ